MADSKKTWVFPAVINPLAAKTNSKTCQGGDRAAAAPGDGSGAAGPAGSPAPCHLQLPSPQPNPVLPRAFTPILKN